MKKIFTILLCLISFQPVFSQHNADNWYFGVLAGLNFSPGGVNVITVGALNTGEGCSSISDGAGNTLFYTDGVSVWNKSHALMPNGDSLMGGPSSTQSALIVPMPGSNSLYYIFTVDQDGGANGFRYSMVDMTLLAGAGDVSVKNIPVLPNVTEKLTAVQKDNTSDCWVAVHEWGSDAFYVYEVNSSGIQPNPVVSNTGIVHNNSQIQNTYGQMKFNACGDKIACADGYLNTVEVFDFNNSTGVISNPLNIPMTDHVYGLEFSANGRFLYVTCYDPSETLVQFDLAAGNTAAVIASKTVLSQTSDLYGMQLGRDGKIYVTKSFNTFLSVINDPEVAGTACNYVDNGINLDPLFTGITTGLSLPGFVQSTLLGEAICVTTGVDQSLDQIQENVFPNPSTHDFSMIKREGFAGKVFRVFDVAGRCVESFKIDSTSENFHFGENLSPGIYYLRSQSGERSVQIIKM